MLKLPATLTAFAFLPSRARIVKLTFEPTSLFPENAEVGDVYSAEPERNPRALAFLADEFSLANDEETACIEAAGDVLASILSAIASSPDVAVINKASAALTEAQASLSALNTACGTTARAYLAKLPGPSAMERALAEALVEGLADNAACDSEHAAKAARGRWESRPSHPHDECGPVGHEHA